MSSPATLRKPLGVRVTPDQHRILTEAAAREHRSVSSFVLNAALGAAQIGVAPTKLPERVLERFRVLREEELAERAAKDDTAENHPPRTQEEVDTALQRIRELMRPYHDPGRSLVDELIAERRTEAARE